MTKKIFRSITAVALIVLSASLFIAISFLYGYFNQLQSNRLKEELSLAANGVERNGITYLTSVDSSAFRFTLISPDGSVLYDSQKNSSEMENHRDREEVSEALKGGRGSSARYSSTLTERTFYEALRLSSGDVLRISATQITLGALIIGMYPAICAIILFSVITALVLSQRMAKKIVKPLEKLGSEGFADSDTYEELAPILSKLDKQHRQITQQMRELKQKSDEFRQITSSMSEGLILLDKNGAIISINTAAEKLFGADENSRGKSFLTIDRTPAINKAVNRALSGKHSEIREERGGGEYQFMVSATESGGVITGVVILCFDVTETAFAERNRKEFTANVSHELKTPLQSIIGSAELLENGLVKPEDVGKFVGNIKTEAARLVDLINDIIRLSQLDEDNDLPTEAVDLYDLSREVIDVLGAAAAKKQVDISLEGEHLTIDGVRSYLYQIVYNLCDNSIRYNTEGGKVEISVKKDNDNVVLKVSDTGIGIPAEHQNRIFERFYRVDKSHSKETGGTGLGLSIVKHAAAYHGGVIKLDSAVGKGTTVTVTF